MKEELQLDPGADDRRSAPDPVQTLIVPLWRSRGLIAVAAVAGLCIGGLWAALQPNAYQSVGKLLVRAGAREEGTQESRIVDADRSGGLSSREAVSNELHLLSNPVVYEKVAARIGPKRLLAPYDPKSQDGPNTSFATGLMHEFQSWWFVRRASTAEHAPDDCGSCVSLATQLLRETIQIQAEGGSSVLTVTGSAHSAGLASEIVAVFLEEAIVHHQAIFASDSSLAFLDTQVQNAQKVVDDADAELSAYRISCGFYDLEGQRTSLLDDIHAVERQLGEDVARMATLEATAEVLRKSFAGEAPVAKVVVGGALVPNPQVAALKQSELRLRQDITALEARTDRTEKQIANEKRALLDQIDMIARELVLQPAFLDPGSSLQDAPNARWTRLRDRIDEVDEELTALHSGSAKRHEHLAHLRAQLVKLEQCGPTLRSLETTASQSQALLAQYVASRSRTGTMNLLDHANMINLRRLQEADVPLRKSGPSRGRSVAIAGMLGLAFGFAAAFARHGLDRRLRSADELESLLGAPVLGAVREAPLERIGKRKAS